MPRQVLRLTNALRCFRDGGALGLPELALFRVSQLKVFSYLREQTFDRVARTSLALKAKPQFVHHHRFTHNDPP
jgi:hypothetical protein